MNNQESRNSEYQVARATKFFMVAPYHFSIIILKCLYLHTNHLKLHFLLLHLKVASRFLENF
jgi:hypothetical protein